MRWMYNSKYSKVYTYNYQCHFFESNINDNHPKHILNDVQRNNIVKDIDMSSLKAPWQNGPYINKHIEPHKKNAEH